jgi:Skp family chaperone for outer membrane proteins
MITRTSILNATAALLLAVSAAAAGAEPEGGEPAPAPAPRALRIAVVNIDRVLSEYKKSNDRYEQIEADFAEITKEFAQKVQFVREEQARLAEDARTDRVAYLEKKQRIELELAKLAKEEKEMVARRTEKEIEAMMEVWSDTITAVAKYAKDAGLDMVIKQQELSKTPKAKSTFHRRVGAMTVLYSAAHLDITDEVIRQMNTEYERGLDAAKG